MSDLSADELTVLLIAAKGEPMMPIARWKGPTESLIAKGFLKPRGHPGDPTGYFNNVITPEGMAEAGRQDTIYDQQLGEMITSSRVIAHEQKKARANAEAIAVQLVDLAEMSSRATGDDKVEALRNWARVILERALEMMR
jgi:hypothetical protein